MSGSFSNNLVTIDFKVPEALTLEKIDDGYNLTYCDDIHAAPFSVKFKAEDIKEAKVFDAGQFEPCPYVQIVILTLADGSELEFFEDVQ
jgi:hypothetical protein